MALCSLYFSTTHLLTDDRDADRRRFVASFVDRDDSEHICACLRGIEDGSTARGNVVQDAGHIHLIDNGCLRGLVVDRLRPEQIYFPGSVACVPTVQVRRCGGRFGVHSTGGAGRHRDNVAWRRYVWRTVQITRFDGGLICCSRGQPVMTANRFCRASTLGLPFTKT